VSILTALLAIVATLFGLYEIVYGFYAYRLNGFKFYITAGFLIGVPFLIVGVILFLRADQPADGWEFLIFVLWAFGVGWKAWRKQIARKAHPIEWEKWERILHGS
jgi:hypothetical protein